MRARDQIAMAWRNLSRQKVRTTLTLVANAIGAAAVISVLTLTFSVNTTTADYFESTGLLRSIDIEQRGPSAVKTEVIDQIAQLPGVAGVTPVIDMWFFQTAEFNGAAANSFTSRATESNGSVTRIVTAGRDLTASDTGAVALVSTDIANALTNGNPAALVDQQINLVTDSTYRGPSQTVENCDLVTFSCNATRVPVTVLGIIDAERTMAFPLQFGRDQKTESMISVLLDSMGQPAMSCADFTPIMPGESCTDGVVTNSVDTIARDGYSGVHILADSDESIDTIAVALSEQFGIFDVNDIQSTGDLRFTVGRDKLASVNATFQTISTLLLSIGAVALLVSAIGVINTMMMATLERTREIGVMRAIGATRSNIRNIFTTEAALLGLGGGILGFFVGAGGLYVASLMVSGSGDRTNPLSSDFFTLITTGLLPASIVIVLTTLIGVVAGAIPARRAALLDPVEAVRYE